MNGYHNRASPRLDIREIEPATGLGLCETLTRRLAHRFAGNVHLHYVQMRTKRHRPAKGFPQTGLSETSHRSVSDTSVFIA